jgi:hypothetical protein
MIYSTGMILWLPTKRNIPSHYHLAAETIEDRHPWSTKDRSLYLPIYPSRAHPDNGMLLTLKGDKRLSQSQTSYVILKPRRTIKAVLLRPQKRKCQLSPQSQQQLIKHIGVESSWPTAVQVRQAFLNQKSGHNPWSELTFGRTNSARSYTSNYERPFSRDTPQYQSTYLYPYHQQAILPQTIHRSYRPDVHKDQMIGWELLRLLLILAVVVVIILDETKSF